MLLAAAAALLGAAQVVLIVAWLMMAPDRIGRVLLAFPWLVLCYLVTLGALRAARREPRGTDDAGWDVWDDPVVRSRKHR